MLVISGVFGACACVCWHYGNARGPSVNKWYIFPERSTLGCSTMNIMVFANFLDAKKRKHGPKNYDWHEMPISQVCINHNESRRIFFPLVSCACPVSSFMHASCNFLYWWHSRTCYVLREHAAERLLRNSAIVGAAVATVVRRLWKICSYTLDWSSL